jgi:hypothetical protein
MTTLAQSVTNEEANSEQLSRLRKRLRGLRPYATNSTGSLTRINLVSRTVLPEQGNEGNEGNKKQDIQRSAAA